MSIDVEVTDLFCYGCGICNSKLKNRDGKYTYDAFKSQGELDRWETKNFKNQAEYRRSHFGHGFKITPIFRFIQISAYYICILHLLLRVVGALWKHCVAKRVVTVPQANKLTSLLHKKLRVYVAPLNTNSKAEIVAHAKNISITGEESVRVVEHFEDCVDTVVEHAGDKAKAMRAIKYFIRFYNLLNSRVHDTTSGHFLTRDQMKPLLAAKATQLHFHQRTVVFL